MCVCVCVWGGEGGFVKGFLLATAGLLMTTAFVAPGGAATHCDDIALLGLCLGAHTSFGTPTLIAELSPEAGPGTNWAGSLVQGYVPVYNPVTNVEDQIPSYALYWSGSQFVPPGFVADGVALYVVQWDETFNQVKIVINQVPLIISYCYGNVGNPNCGSNSAPTAGEIRLTIFDKEIYIL